MRNHLLGRSCDLPTLLRLTLALGVLLCLPMLSAAQGPGLEEGQWTFLGGDAWHTRYTTADQINASNFQDLELAWQFNAASFGKSTSRATPSYVDGKLITVTGERRHVIALDPATGELLWSFTEPNTFRYEYSMRKGYGKGHRLRQRSTGAASSTSPRPGFFPPRARRRDGEAAGELGKASRHPEGFPKSGTVDLVWDLIQGWGPWENWDKPYDAVSGHSPRARLHHELLSPDRRQRRTVVIGNSAEQGYNQTRRKRTCLETSSATTPRNGSLKWKFHVIPRPGEFGHDTWENDAWEWTGDISSWAPMSADPELGMVYIPTNGPTIDYYGGFHPGDNLYGTSLIALDAETGERQMALPVRAPRHLELRHAHRSSADGRDR